MTTLSRRALNRALLQRQFLLDRTDLPALNVLGHLVAMQAQEPNWPYVGLWSRIRHFTHADLATLRRGRDSRILAGEVELRTRSSTIRPPPPGAAGAPAHRSPSAPRGSTPCAPPCSAT